MFKMHKRDIVSLGQTVIRQALYWLMLTVSLIAANVSAAEDQWQGVERIIAVGDIHGDYDHYIEVLTHAGLINRRGNWDAGETHFVQLGDIPDRGPDTDRVIRHMQQLEAQAQRAGGRVHALVGNHEMMNVAGDLRYVHPGEYEALRSRRARSLRDSYYQRVVAYLLSQEDPPVIDEAFRQQWEQEYPLGYVEHRNYWSSQGEFGKWVLEHNTIIKINNILFIHGGISPEYLDMGIREINERVRSELGDLTLAEPRITELDSGPLWYRGLALNDAIEELPHVEQILEVYNVDHIVVGHTPGYGTIVPRFDGKVLVIDSGISAYYGGHLASLLVENDQLTNIQQGEAIAIPKDNDNLIAYYESVLELEPESINLKNLVNRLKNPSLVSEPVVEPNI